MQSLKKYYFQISFAGIVQRKKLFYKRQKKSLMFLTAGKKETLYEIRYID